jgi:hypothetical protein
MDINIVNNANDISNTAPYPAVVFNEIRNSPYLMNPSDYFMSVVRFKLETSLTLPTYIPQIQPNTINDTVYSFTMVLRDSSGGVDVGEYREFVGWVPEDLSVPVPPTGVGNQTSPFYWGYNIQHFVNRMNQTVSNICQYLGGLITAPNRTGNWLSVSTEPPFFVLDQGTKRLSLSAAFDKYVIHAIPPRYTLKMFCNLQMFNWISSFPAFFYGTTASNGKNYQFDFRMYSGISNLYVVPNSPNVDPSFNVVPPLPNYNAVQIFQEYSTTDLWAAVDKLVFTTGLVPVSAGLATKPLVYNTNTTDLLNTGNNSNIILQITDFIDQGTEGLVLYKPAINYIPTAEYRLVDLFGNNPLSSFDISVFWSDKYGNLYPFRLASGCNASIKILFRRKDYQGGRLD